MSEHLHMRRLPVWHTQKTIAAFKRVMVRVKLCARCAQSATAALESSKVTSSRWCFSTSGRILRAFTISFGSSGSASALVIAYRPQLQQFEPIHMQYSPVERCKKEKEM